MSKTGKTTGKATMGKSGKLGGGKSGRGKKGKKLGGSGGGIGSKIGKLEHQMKGKKSSSMLYFTVAIAAVLGIVFVVKMMQDNDSTPAPSAQLPIQLQQ